ncbi:hypothetical protein PG985_014185 [Apiospora marii]|uniref:uncharacterized protein n=1 Tax=Apiospora marii TaxID=335849 RepID=UPI00312DDC0D
MFALSMLPRAGSLAAACAILAGGLFLFCIYYLYVRHLFSPFRNLPSPAQGPLWLRLLYEPRLPEIEHWIDTIPNEGLIRYHWLFNSERVFITSPEATKEFLTTSAYKFVKPKLQYTLANLIAGRGLLILEGEEHKQVRKTLNPAFSPANLREWFPAQWKAAIDALSIIPRYTDVDVDYAPDDGPQAPFAGVTTIQVPIAAPSIDILCRQCAEPAVIAGTAIPQGTTVTFSPWALNRDPRHWGPDARVFDPDRWVANPTTGGADHPYAFATFGGGPRRCIGEGYARDQLLCVLAAYVGR